VLVKEPKYRRPLSSSQIDLLLALYKFRFVSTDLLAGLTGKDRSTIYESLYVLVNQGYIGKRYDKTYRFAQKPATYFLIARGIRYLREHNKQANLSQTVLRNYYKNKNAAQTIIDHCLEVIAIYIALQKQYPNVFNIFTKADCHDDDWLINPLPDLYLERKHFKDDKTNRYMLEIVEAGLYRWQLIKRLRAYQNHCDEEWDEDKRGVYPDVLLVTRNNRTELRLQGFIENMLQDFKLYTTTVDKLFTADKNHQAVWMEVFEPEELIAL
jgi:DNA-binding PadR family transcriptional regulator